MISLIILGLLFCAAVSSSQEYSSLTPTPSVIIRHVRSGRCLTTELLDDTYVEVAVLGDCNSIASTQSTTHSWLPAYNKGPIYSESANATAPTSCLASEAYWGDALAIKNGQGSYGCRFPNARWSFIPTKGRFQVQQIASGWCLEPLMPKNGKQRSGTMIYLKACKKKNNNQHWQVCLENDPKNCNKVLDWL